MEKKINWIDIRAENRKEVTDYLQELNLYSNLHECIEKPEEYPVLNTFEKTNVLNISISDAADIYKTDYATVILDNNLFITIASNLDDFFNASTLSVYKEKKYTSLRSFLFYILAVKILDQE